MCDITGGGGLGVLPHKKFGLNGVNRVILDKINMEMALS